MVLFFSKLTLRKLLTKSKNYFYKVSSALIYSFCSKKLPHKAFCADLQPKGSITKDKFNFKTNTDISSSALCPLIIIIANAYS